MSKTVVFILLSILVILVFFGLYEKDRRKQLLIDFKSNKPLLCQDEIIQLEKKWMIHHNRFFTNGDKFYTIIFCESL